MRDKLTLMALFPFIMLAVGVQMLLQLTGCCNAKPVPAGEQRFGASAKVIPCDADNCGKKPIP